MMIPGSQAGSEDVNSESGLDWDEFIAKSIKCLARLVKLFKGTVRAQWAGSPWNGNSFSPK